MAATRFYEAIPSSKHRPELIQNASWWSGATWWTLHYVKRKLPCYQKDQQTTSTFDRQHYGKEGRMSSNWEINSVYGIAGDKYEIICMGKRFSTFGRSFLRSRCHTDSGRVVNRSGKTVINSGWKIAVFKSGPWHPWGAENIVWKIMAIYCWIALSQGDKISTLYKRWCFVM